MLHKVCVEWGLEIHPNKTSLLILLSREDICNKVIPIEEPPEAKDIKNIKHRGLVSALQTSN